MPGTKRFGELKAIRRQCQPKVLTAQLRQMEESGLRPDESEVPHLNGIYADRAGIQPEAHFRRYGCMGHGI